jgi:hypothetical protein
MSEGIVGQCFSERGTLVENFNDEQEFEVSMTSRYGYPVEAARRRNRSRRSYLVQAVTGDHDEVLGVVYLDSDVRGAFPPAVPAQATRVLDRLVDDLSQLAGWR